MKKMPKIGIGAIVQGNDSKDWVRKDDYMQMLHTCIDELDIDHFDSAEAYQMSEQCIGTYLKDKPNHFREKIFLSTKVIYDLEGIRAGRDPKPYCKEHIQKAFQQSINALAVDYVDAYYIHGPHPDENNWPEIMQTLSDLVDQGKVKHIGISNIYSTTQLEEIFEACEKGGYHRPKYLQNENHPIYFKHASALNETALSLNMHIVAFSPLASGTLSGKYAFTTDHQHLPEGSRWSVWKGRFPPPYWTETVFTAIQEYKKMALSLDHTPSSLGLAWSLCNPQIGTTLIGPRVPGHLDAIRIAAKNPINQIQFEEINNMFADCLPSFDYATRSIK